MTAEDKKISSIYQQTSRTEPPEHLDKAILAASRQAVDNNTHARAPFSGGWPVPVSMVAVVIVAIIIVPVVMHESGPEKSIPATASDIASEQPYTGSESTSRRKLELQPLTDEDEIQSLPSKLLQSAPSEAHIDAPATAPPIYPIYEQDAISSETGIGRLNKQLAPALRERKAIASQSFMNNELEESLRTPDAWIAYINDLLSANEIEKAKLEIQAFTQVYPDYAIEPELNDLLD